jgi:membrane protease YdiL (CAAX protease family)
MTDAPVFPETLSPTDDLPLFHSFTQPESVVLRRIPHLGHLAFLALLALVALLCVSGLTQLALHYRLFGISTVEAALTDIHYTLGTMAILYLLTFASGLLLFPLFWHKSLLAGLQWNVSSALHHRQRLLATAGGCFVLAIVNGILLPGPNDTPIDKMFSTPGAAWLLFGFGVTFAPFFEEIVFRGFLLPALATAFDWVAERTAGKPPREPDESGHPQWSLSSMTLASVLTSVPFALMHGEQTGWAIGPFLMLVGVSLVLCWVRLSTRSLAASVLVHTCYNFMLFSLMLLGTEGFRHLNKL